MRKLELRPWTSIDHDEYRAARDVLADAWNLRSPLSGFLGGQPDGGPQVQALEREWCETFGARHAVSVNSATSGLLIALKACGVGPGDEVIVSPFSMSATVAVVCWCGATPVFVDVGDDYCLSTETVKRAITPRTEAALVTDLFGKIADCHGLVDYLPVIEDASQAPFAGRHFGDIVVFSMNVHKPIQCGEGGICTTKNDKIDYNMKLLRKYREQP